MSGYATVLVSSLLLAGVLLASPVAAGEPATHPFSIHDMLAMERISDPQLSPDGRQVVFTLRSTDLEADKGRTDLWLVGVDAQGLRRLTSHPASDANPRWSSDGKSIWFLSSRSDSSQVWRIAIDGGEAQQVSDLPLDVSSLAVAPGGKRIAMSVDVFPDCDTLACSRERLDAIEARATSARVYERLFVRHWDTWKDGRRAHLFVMPVTGGEAVDTMRGMDADCPSKPFGGPEEYTFTPDGEALVFSARDAGREEAWSTDFDLYLAPARVFDHGQRGLGYRTRVLARRQDAGLQGDACSGLRVRSLPHRATHLAGRCFARVDREMGPLSGHARLVGRRKDDLRQCREQR